MAVTWHDVPVFLTWQARLGPPRREWTERFAAEIRRSDALDQTEAELAARLGPLAAEMDAEAEVRSERMPNPALMIRLVAPVEAGEPVPGPDGDTDTWWQRIRWPDDALMPAAGEFVSLDSRAGGSDRGPQREVVSARPTFEPGWIEVELRRGS